MCINAFDWRAAFPDVFSHGGFDCVIGNPPYIKLQHFRRAQADTAAYLVEAKNPDGSPIYASTQSGNFDMCLPFIEKGIRLLKAEGRMGYIAPNVWMVNEYGKPLRKLIRRTRTLDRWLDFKSHQIFDEAITYTALQFFRGSANEALTCAFAPDGNAAAVQWENADRILFEDLPEDDAWILAPRQEKEMLQKLLVSHPPLSSFAAEKAVGFRGIESGADEFYHFDKVAPNRYVGAKNGARMDMRGVKAELDDGIMRKLVSSEDAKRYTRPNPIRHTIFPYRTDEKTAALLSESEIQSNFPLCQKWFESHEQNLRQRDTGAMNLDVGWYAYTRPMNLHLQEKPKIGIPQTVLNLNGFFDSGGEFCFNNVRVGAMPLGKADNLEFIISFAGVVSDKSRPTAYWLSHFSWARSFAPWGCRLPDDRFPDTIEDSGCRMVIQQTICGGEDHPQGFHALKSFDKADVEWIEVAIACCGQSLLGHEAGCH